MPTLDVPFRQVLIDFFLDPNGYFWHHRLLLVPCGGAVWIGVTPDLAVQRIDLSAHRVHVLGRNCAFPQARAAQTYGFDPDEVDAPTLARLLTEAKVLAEVLGVVVAVGIGGGVGSTEVWRISDTRSPLFSEEVPAGALGNDDVFVQRGDVALVSVDGVWTTAAREGAELPGLIGFRRSFHNGKGRDPRLLADERDKDGRRFLSLLTALSLIQEYAWPHWPIDGPRAAKEFLNAIRGGGIISFLDYHTEWVKACGVGEKSGIAREHRFLLEFLRLLVQWDQLDITSLAGAELVVRRIFQIETAVKKNPRQPDFEGLEYLLETAVDSSGGAVMPQITKWLGENQRNDAFVLKQMRLWSEEKTAATKRKGAKD
jgi:hypothetical protein